MNCNFIIFFAFTFIICLCFILFWYEYCPVYIFADSGSWRCVEGIHDKRLHVFWGIFAWLCIHNKLHWDIRKVKFIALVWFIFYSAHSSSQWSSTESGRNLFHNSFIFKIAFSNYHRNVSGQHGCKVAFVSFFFQNIVEQTIFWLS